MTTSGIFEIKKLGSAVLLYGTHDSYPGGWPKDAIERVLQNADRPLDKLKDDLLDYLRSWDRDVHRTAIRREYSSSVEKEVDRLVRNNFREIKPSDIPKNIEKGWDYMYIVDLDTRTVIVLYPKEFFRFGDAVVNPVVEVHGEKAVKKCMCDLENYAKIADYLDYLY